MQPFLEIPIGITNVEKQEKKTVCRIKPGKIDYYYPGFHDGTVIVFESGDCLFSTLTYDQVDAALQAYDAHTRKHPNQFGNLEIKPQSPAKPLLHVAD
jgi:hypothetical protein